MDYEEKYKEALERASKLRVQNPFDTVSQMMEHVFPELAESEDELVWLTKYIEEEAYYLSMDIRDDEDRIKLKKLQKSLAWLEEHGKPLENYDEAEKEKADFVGDGFIECHADFLDFKEGNTYWLEYIGDDKYNIRSDNLLGKTYHITPCQLYTVFKKLTWLEKQGEQKPQCKSAVETINEVEGGNRYGVNDTPYNYEHAIMAQKDFSVKQEPKFNVGDWVVDNCGYVWKIEGILNKFYLLEDVDGGESRPTIEWVNKTFHLWTIRDAKDGDVLASEDCNVILIFRNLDNSTSFSSYYNTAGKGELGWSNRTFIPATKEQCDLLLQKMREAGYTFGFDKKELKKIEFNPDDLIEESHQQQADDLIDVVTEKSPLSERDEHWRQKAIDFIRHPDMIKVTPTLAKNTVDWLKSIKDRVLSKIEWSEEDDDALGQAIVAVKDVMYSAPNNRYASYKLPFSEVIERLKSIRGNKKEN